MADLGQGQVGTLKSTPKLTKINGDDHTKVIYRNMGNNHAYPMVWGTTVTMVSGTSEIVAMSGIKWHGYDLASYASVVATPEGELGYLQVEKDTTANTITIKSSASAADDVNIALVCMLGGDLTASGFNCKG